MKYLKKSDLKDGMKVKLREGRYMFALVSRGLLYSVPEPEVMEGMTYDGYLELKSYTDDLLHSAEEDFIEKDFDMMEIYDTQDNLIWQRVNWNELSFGTEVICWDNKNGKYRGRFLEYIPNCIKPFRVYIEGSKPPQTAWDYCELAEEVQETEDLTVSQLEDGFRDMCRKYKKCEDCNYENERKDGDIDYCKWRYLLDNYNVTRK